MQNGGSGQETGRTRETEWWRGKEEAGEHRSKGKEEAKMLSTE